MTRQTKKLIAGLSSIFGGYGIGIAVFFILDMLQDFSRKARLLPVVFTVGFVAVLVLYFIYWARAKKLDTDKKKKPISTLCCLGGIGVCIACVAVAFLAFSSALNSQDVTIALFVEMAMLLIGNVCAYILGKI